MHLLIDEHLSSLIGARGSTERAGRAYNVSGLQCGIDGDDNGGIAMVATLERREVRGRTRPAIIDCDFHNELDSIKDLFPYLSQRWRDHIET
jgi:hypothetical protein